MYLPEALAETETKVSELINLAEKFQDGSMFEQWHEYCSLLSARFIVRIWGKDREEKI